MDGMPAREQERILLHELGEYRPDLLERQRLVVATKTDAADAQTIAEWTGSKMSAVTRDGVRKVLGDLAVLEKHART